MTHGSTREMGDPLRRTRPRPGVTWATEVAVCERRDDQKSSAERGRCGLTFFLPKHWTADIFCEPIREEAG